MSTPSPPPANLVLLFSDDGEIPNHPSLPFVCLRVEEVVSSDDPAAWFEERFVSHDWSATWRWGVYPFPHFHRTAHEVLGVARGWARLRIGGERGRDLEVAVGDVLVIPAGVGHQCLEASDDFLVVGAYPGGREPDLVRPPAGPEDRARIAAVPLPAQDPLHGKFGPLLDHWKV